MTKCHDNVTCIRITYILNGRVDCPDGSDENKNYYKTCPEGYMRCNNGQCIWDEYWCDGKEDCKDESNEGRNCITYQCLDYYWKWQPCFSYQVLDAFFYF